MNEKIFKAIRLRAGLTQREFAEELGISESTVAAIEKQRRPISDQVRARLALKFDITQDFLEFYDRISKFS